MLVIILFLGGSGRIKRYHQIYPTSGINKRIKRDEDHARGWPLILCKWFCSILNIQIL
jgi:hypothetical protein